MQARPRQGSDNVGSLKLEALDVVKSRGTPPSSGDEGMTPGGSLAFIFEGLTALIFALSSG
ncbi:hypothetical protein E4U54_007806 [Claviceps lovelessii]|nr:hypothetical protein E4U54_007806 [Claviceps lovelessii]